MPSSPCQGVPHPCPSGEGLCHPVLARVVPHPYPGQGVPHAVMAGGGGYPIQSWLEGVGTPSSPGQREVAPSGKDMGPVEALWNGDGYPSQKGHGTSGSIMGWGNPCEQTDICENSTFPILRIRAVKVLDLHLRSQ